MSMAGASRMEASSKAAVREQVRMALSAIPQAERAALSLQLCHLLRHELAWQRSTQILGFAPLTNEPDIMPLLEEAWTSGRRIALPSYDAHASAYVARAVMHRGEMQRGRFGVCEPLAGCPVIPLNQLDFILVPGVAFDLVGRRLGRGKGFYDRLLAQVRGHKCGVAFDAQIVAEVPEELHDIRVDSILTPTRWHLCPQAA